MKGKIKYAVLVSLIMGFMSGCTVNDQTQDYRNAKMGPALELPPEFNSASIKPAPAVAPVSAAVATKAPVQQAKPLAQHIVVKGDRTTVWNKLKAFWPQKNMSVSYASDSLGILSTSKDVNGSSYRASLERGEVADTTAIYLTASNSSQKQAEKMLSSIAAYFGASAVSKPIKPSKANIISSGSGSYIMVLGTREQTISKVKSFLNTQKLKVAYSNNLLGMLNTTTDKAGYAYRVRIERSSVAGNSNIYLSEAQDVKLDKTKNQAMQNRLLSYLNTH